MKKFGTKLGVLNPELSAGEVSLMSRYSTNKKSFERIVEEEVSEINGKIDTTIRFSADKVYPKVVTPDQRPLYEAVRKRFEQRGFKVFFVNNNSVPELNGTEVMFISWDVNSDEEKEFIP